MRTLNPICNLLAPRVAFVAMTLVAFVVATSAAYAKPAPERVCFQTTVDREIEVRTLAATAAAEARSEGIDGMKNVITVVMNRADLIDHPSAVMVALMAPKQFSVWDLDSTIRSTMIAAIEQRTYDNYDFARWFEFALPLARSAMDGQRSSHLGPTFLNYFNPQTAATKTWETMGIEYVRLGRHVFVAGVAPLRYPRCPIVHW